MKSIALIVDIANQIVIGGTKDNVEEFKYVELEADDVIVLTTNGDYAWSVIKRPPRIADALNPTEPAKEVKP